MKPRSYITYIAAFLLLLLVGPRVMAASDATQSNPDQATATLAAGSTTHAEPDGGHGSTNPKANGSHGVAQTVSTNGKFNAPEMVIPDRPDWGAEVGQFQPFHVVESAELDGRVVTGFWITTVLAVVMTIVFAIYNSKIQRSDGASQRGFTLGTKLVLGFGVLTSMIMLVSTFSVTGQYNSNHKAHEFSDIVGDAQLLEALQRDVLMVRMNVKDFLITNSDHDLKQYSDYLAATKNKLEACQTAIHNPTRVQLIGQVREAVDQYESLFAKVVETIDERNATIDSQMNPTAARATLLIEEIMHTAETDGDLAAALKAAEIDAELGQARAGAFKYIRSSNIEDQQSADLHLNKAIEMFTQLEREVQNPHRRACLAEAKQTFRFYADRLHSTVALVDTRNELVKDNLDVLGPQIAATGVELLESIAATEAQLHQENEAASKASFIQSVTSSTVAVIIGVLTATLLIRSITASIRKVLAVLHSVAEGDLTNEPLNMTSTDEMGSLARATDQMSESLRSLLVEVSSSSSEVASSATQIAASSEEMSRGMSEQSQQVMQVSSAIEEMSASVVEVARKSTEASSNAAEAGKVAGEGGRVVEETIEGMNAISEAVNAGAGSVGELGKRSQQIGQIVETINDIADQTNLLALNAAIEAARAGEHGRGFAVVADEVRKLADRTTQATDEIAESIQAIQTETGQAVDRMKVGTQQVQTGVEKASTAGDNLRRIVTSSQDVAGMIQSIAAAAEQQSAASEQIAANVNSINSVTTQTNEAASQSAKAASQLSTKAEQLQGLVKKFKT